MMKRIVSFVLVLAGVFALSGCDYIRASLGKPTSADLEVLRQEKAAREQAARDSVAAALEEEVRETALRMAEKAAADSIAASVPKRYYAVAGAFREAAGAQVYIDKLKDNGFAVRTFDFKSGLKVVCVEGSDDLSVVRGDMERLKSLKIAPSDPWIYNTTKKLHKE